MANNRNRIGTQNAAGSSAAGAARRRNAAYEFGTEVGANAPAGSCPASNQANRTGRNAQRNTVNVRGEYGR